MLCGIFEKLGRLYTSWHAFYAFMWILMVALSSKEIFFHDMLRVLHLRGIIPFFALVHTFFCSMLSEGVLVFRGSVLLSCICLGGACGFCAPFYCSVDYVFSSRLCWDVVISLGAEIFPSRFGICDASHASDFDIDFYEAFVHLNMNFCLSFDPLDEIFSFCLSNHFLCFNVVKTLIKGEIIWKSSWYEPLIW